MNIVDRLAFASLLIGACARPPGQAGPVPPPSVAPSPVATTVVSAWEPPAAGSTLAASELSPLLSDARANGWSLYEVSNVVIVLRKDDEHLVLRLRWAPIVEHGQTVATRPDVATLPQRLGFEELLRKARQEEDAEGIMRSYELRELEGVAVDTRHAVLTATECGPERLEGLAQALAGDSVFSFLLYANNDHDGPPGSNPGDVDWLLSDSAARADLSAVHCSSPRIVSEEDKARSALSELFSAHSLKGFTANAGGVATLEFQLPYGETLLAEVRMNDGDGGVRALSSSTTNVGRHSRTYFKERTQLAARLAEGPIETLAIRESALIFSGSWGEFEVYPEALCCLAEEGERGGEEVCSQERAYEAGLVCGE